MLQIEGDDDDLFASLVADANANTSAEPEKKKRGKSDEEKAAEEAKKKAEKAKADQAKAKQVAENAKRYTSRNVQSAYGAVGTKLAKGGKVQKFAAGGAGKVRKGMMKGK
jgi:hypothetical protein